VKNLAKAFVESEGIYSKVAMVRQNAQGLFKNLHLLIKIPSLFRQCLRLCTSLTQEKTKTKS
jgi:hypothetical protein